MKRLSPFVALWLAASPAFSGGYLTGINFAQSVDAINHPVLYLGAGGERTIRVCMDPQITDADLREPAVERALATWTTPAGENGNLTHDFPEQQVDFETVLLHEMGHCLFGLAHPNLGGLVEDFLDSYATAAKPGPNGEYDVQLGSDAAPGSVDDAPETYRTFRRMVPMHE